MTHVVTLAFKQTWGLSAHGGRKHKPICEMVQYLNEGLVGGLKKGDDVIIERVHILGQPLSSLIVHTTSVVADAKIRCGTKLGFEKLWVALLLLEELFHKRLVRSLGKEALLVEKCQDTHGLHEE